MRHAADSLGPAIRSARPNGPGRNRRPIVQSISLESDLVSPAVTGAAQRHESEACIARPLVVCLPFNLQSGAEAEASCVLSQNWDRMRGELGRILASASVAGFDSAVRFPGFLPAGRSV